MPVYGATTLNLSLGLALITLVIMGLYVKRGDYRLFLTAERTALGVSFLVLLSTVTLVANLMKGNFDVDFVARYTSTATPAAYKFAALWAGQSGSLLFWLFILSVYATVVILQNRGRHHQLMPYVIITLTTIQLFFLLVVNFVTNPFSPVEADFVLRDGLGLNPLLQNPTMAIHPPMLYLGYVAFRFPLPLPSRLSCPGGWMPYGCEPSAGGRCSPGWLWGVGFFWAVTGPITNWDGVDTGPGIPLKTPRLCPGSPRRRSSTASSFRKRRTC